MIVLSNWFEHYIDRRLGVIICFLLTVVDALLRRLGVSSATPPPVKRILFVKPVEQGAVVLAYGAIKRAAERVGRENVFFFVFEKNREILDILDVVPRQNVITARDENLFILGASMLRAIVKMRRLRIDTAVDLEIFARLSIIIAYLSGAKRRVGLHRFNSEGPYRGALVTHRVQYNPYLHTAQAFDVFTRAAFVDGEEAPLLKEAPQTPPCPPPKFTPNPQDMEGVAEILAALAAPDAPRPHPIILFNPKCLDELPSRQWAGENFIALGRLALNAYPDARILITGLPAEREACERMAAAIDEKRCLSLAGKQSLRSLIALMTVSDFLVTTDSGPAHFAAMTEIAGVVLFGPETPLLYSPLSEKLRVSWLGLACSPCFSPMNYRLSPCSNNRCLQGISAESVFALLQTMIQEGTAPAA